MNSGRVIHSVKQHHVKKSVSEAHPNAMYQARQNQRFQHQETLPSKTVANNNDNNKKSNSDDDDDDDELQLPKEWTY